MRCLPHAPGIVSGGNCNSTARKVKSMQRQIPLVISSGAPFERGLQFGRQEQRRVQQSIRAYQGIFRLLHGLRQNDIYALAEQFLPVIATHTPALLEEMRGIAEGAGCDLREIIAINARTELMYGVKSMAECTALGIQSAISSDGHVRLAQNWDWHAAQAGSVVLWDIRPSEGQRIVTLTEAGIVGKIGMNAAGLGMCINLLVSDSDHPGPALPMHVILRHLLDEARSVHEAVTLLASTPRCTSCHHLLADRTGVVAGVETTPMGQHVIAPTQGIVTHTNHCYDQALFACDKGAREEPETLARGERIRHLAQRPTIDTDAIQLMLSDHDTTPNSICLHVQPDAPAGKHSESVASIIMDLTAGTIDVADGPPCQYPYRRMYSTHDAATD